MKARRATAAPNRVRFRPLGRPCGAFVCPSPRRAVLDLVERYASRYRPHPRRERRATIERMTDAERPARNRGGILQLAGAQAVLIGLFLSLLGLGFFPMAELIFGGAALVVLGVTAILVGSRRKRARV